MTKKFTQFNNGGNFLATDEAVGLRGVTNTRFTLNFQNPTILGSGDPNGFQAGTAGKDRYFDTVAKSYWDCITTGTALTAVWQEFVSTTLESIVITSATPVQFLSNKIYFASLSSPAANGIMPVNPNVGDVVIIRSNGAAGITVTKGTSLVTIGTTTVATSFFVPVQSTIKLRCFSVTSGGQWSAETIQNSVLIDGTITQNAINNVQLNKTIGSGNPNGSQAGVAGENIYFDSSTAIYWVCVVTGTSSIAVWNILSFGLDPVEIVSATPVQFLSNRIYFANLSSPAANGIMPISPALRDVVIVRSNGAAGITVDPGTGIVRIGDTTVVTSFFVPLNVSIILRCFSTSSGGQWSAEAITGSVLIDGSITQNAIGNIQLNKASNLSDVADPVASLANIGGQPIIIQGTGDPNGTVGGTAGISLYSDPFVGLWRCAVSGGPGVAIWVEVVTRNQIRPAKTLYFSDEIGSDSTGNGSKSFPYALYDFVGPLAAALATESDPITVFAMGHEVITGDLILYPFVNIQGENTLTSSLVATGELVTDASFDTIDDPKTLISDVSWGAQSGINIKFNVEKGAKIICLNASLVETPSHYVEGSGGFQSEVFAHLDSLDQPTAPDYSFKNITALVANTQVPNITMNNDGSSAASALVLQNTGYSAQTNVVISGTIGEPGTVFLATNALVGDLQMIDNVTVLLDSSSYPSTISFSGPASFANIILTTSSDSIDTQNNFTPANYTRPVSPSLYPESSATNDLKGIDNQLGIIQRPPVLNAVLFGSSDIPLVAATSTFLVFPNITIDTHSAYDDSTCTYTVTKDGLWDVSYEIAHTGTGGVSTNNYNLDTAIYINGSLNQGEYCTIRDSAVLLGQTLNQTNAGHRIFLLTAGDTIRVRSVNNGNIDLLIADTIFAVNFLGIV